MESSFGSVVCTPENRWQTPQACPYRLREKTPHLRKHRADQTTTLDHQKARRNDLKPIVAERSRRIAIDDRGGGANLSPDLLATLHIKCVGGILRCACRRRSTGRNYRS